MQQQLVQVQVVAILFFLLLLSPGCSEDSSTPDTVNIEAPTSPFNQQQGVNADSVTSPFNTTNDATVPGPKPTDGDSVSDGEIDDDAGGGEDPWGLPEDPEEGDFGWPCDENIECNSGFCVQTPVGKVCTDTCLENCPPAWACSEVTVTGADTTYICKPKYLHLCDPCESNEDCADIAAANAKCLPYGEDGSFCGVDCAEGQGCPTGYSCKSFDGPAGLTYFQCAPDAGFCSCSPLAESLGLTTECSVNNDFGSCLGIRACVEGQGLSQCDGASPEPEVCDNADNDCNGIVDDLGIAQACTVDNEFGSCPGVETCSNGNSSCVGDEPTPELCDGLDNDCDGETDEDLCDDGDPCTKDTCVQLEDTLECSHAIDDSLLCDDGNVCTNTDKCEDGVCVGFNPEICDDGNPCTDDTCDATVGCLTAFNTGECEDGNECTEGDLCANGACQPGAQKTCDDDNPCTSDSCNPAIQGGCVHDIANESAACDSPGLGQCQKAKCSLGTCLPYNADGGGCTTNDSNCSAGVCSGGICNVIPGQICEVDGGICSSDVPGTCTSSGSCVPAADGGCICNSPCNGVCLCCNLGGLFPVQVCIPF